MKWSPCWKAPAMKMKLTARALEALEPAANGKRYDVMDTVIPNLAVRVPPTGKNVYIFLGRFPGNPNPTRRKIGDVASMTLATARRIASEWQDMIASGLDPQFQAGGPTSDAPSGKADEEEATPDSPSVGDSGELTTFKEMADIFMRRHVRKEGQKSQIPLRSADEIQRVLNSYILADLEGNPRWRDRPFEKITRADVTGLLDTVEDNHGTAQADHVLAILSKMFNWHALRTDDFSSPIISGMRRGSPTLSKRKRILDDDEIRALWHCTRKPSPFNVFIRLALLTAQRRAKVIEMKWEELAPNRDWTITTESREKGNPLVLNLSPLAFEVINSLPRLDGNPFIFTGRGKGKRINGFSKPKVALDEAMERHLGKPVPHWIIHDLRRTAKSSMMRAGVSREISERVLGHAIPGAEGVYDQYQYYDEKAAALRKLGTLISKIIRAEARPAR